MSNSDFKLRDDKFFTTGGALADNKGISIASSRVQGEVVTAQYNSIGRVNVFRQNKSITELNEEQGLAEERMSVRSIAKAIVVAIFAVCIMLCVLTKNRIAIMGTIVFLLNAFYTRLFVYTVTWIANVASIQTQEMMLKYNAALHMAMNVFQGERRIPTMDDMKNSTWYSERSSTNEVSKAALKALLQCLLLTVMVIALVFAAVDVLNSIIGLKGYWLAFGIVAVGMGFIILVYRGIDFFVDKGFEHKWLMHLMQKPFMRRPTEKELELALEALKGYEEMEKDIDEHYDEYEPISMQIDLGSGKVVFRLLNGKTSTYTYAEYLEFLINRAEAESCEEESDDKGD